MALVCFRLSLARAALLGLGAFCVFPSLPARPTPIWALLGLGVLVAVGIHSAALQRRRDPGDG